MSGQTMVEKLYGKTGHTETSHTETGHTEVDHTGIDNVETDTAGAGHAETDSKEPDGDNGGAVRENAENHIETIGKIKLDYSRYPGEDFYCDGTVEDELLEIVKADPDGDYRKVAEERKSWPILYHLSPLRENIVDWIPMKHTDKVLEVGSGCGAITGVLSRKAGSVTCVELSKKRSLINAYRHSTCENVTIHVGNFKDIEPGLPSDFDYICLIGVFEYGQGYIGGETPYRDFLKILLPHLARGGRIIIAIENKYGMKYFAGCREDHVGEYFSGIENYRTGDGVRTFSRRGLEGIFGSCGVPEVHFYYPYPDYKFMTDLYSDAYLPGRGELGDNLRNFDRDRMMLFDEKRAFEGVVEEGLFPVFANSYLAVLGGSFETKYVKYSNDRDERYAVRTTISQDVTGRAMVRKDPLDKRAAGHVRGMAAAYENLLERYTGGRLEISQCHLAEGPEGPSARFSFVQGVPLSELMDRCLERGNVDGFHRLLEEYVERAGYNEDCPVSDFDLYFHHILVDGDRWTLIDYEWTFGKKIETKELAYRALLRYLQEDERRRGLDMGRVLAYLGITEEEATYYRQQESEFGQFVMGERLSMAQIRERAGLAVIEPEKQVKEQREEDSFRRVQIYEDRGDGCREEASYFVPGAYQGENQVVLNLPVGGDVKILRIDPAFGTCLVKIRRMELDGEKILLDRKKQFSVNGAIVGWSAEEPRCPSIVFPTGDPNIHIFLDKLPRKESGSLAVVMDVIPLPPDVAQDMAAAAGSARWFRR